MITSIIRPCFIIFFCILIPISNSLYHTYSYGLFLFALALQIGYGLFLNKRIFLYSIIIIFIQILLTSGLNFKAVASGFVLIYCCVVFFEIGYQYYNKKIQDDINIYLIFYVLLCTLVLVSHGLHVFFNFKLIYQGSKPCFPFEEPSHFALFMGPIFIGLSSKFSLRRRFLFSLLLIFFSFYFQSLVFLIFSFISLTLNLLSLLPIKKAAQIFYSIVLLTIVLDYFIIDSYLYSRLIHVFDPNTINISALVYLQGWNSIIDSLSNHVFGIGFQFLGHEPPNFYSLRIQELSGNFVNRQDGGFFLAKFISELGYLGLLIVICATLQTSLIFKRFSSSHAHDLRFIYFIFCGLIVPLLIRDVGYFSYTIFYLCAGLGFLSSISGGRVPPQADQR